MRRPVALTGTPGTGKSSVAARLGGDVVAIEVGALARRLGAATGSGRSIEVDLVRLRRALARPGALAGIDVIVGHLAHLLPVAEAIVLRCHPVELRERLRHARRGSARDRQENFVSEATDVILVEAVDAGLPVFEVDTTGRSVAAVARDVRRRLERRDAPRTGTVDWLADPAVTKLLLGRAR